MNENNWHRNDRVLHRPSGQHGVVEGWKDGKLLINWGLQQEKQGYVRSWVPDEECQWEPAIGQKDVDITERALSSPPSGSSTSLA